MTETNCDQYLQEYAQQTGIKSACYISYSLHNLLQFETNYFSRIIEKRKCFLSMLIACNYKQAIYCYKLSTSLQYKMTPIYLVDCYSTYN